MRKSLLLLTLGAFFVAPSHLAAQQLTAEEGRAVTQVFQKYAVGVQTGPLVVDSCHRSDHAITLFANRNLSYIPVRKDNCREMKADLSSVFGNQFAPDSIHVVTDGKTLESLVPRYYQASAEKRPAFTYPAQTPLVTPLNRPYSPTRGLQNRHIAMWQSHGNYFELALNRWGWQRARMFQTVEDKYTQSYVLPFLIPMLENAGATVLTPRERDLNSHEVVVDNDGGLATSAYEEHDGASPWQTGEEVGFAYRRQMYVDFENPFTEGTYRQTATTTSKEHLSTITWTPSIPEEGRYGVYVSYHSLPNSTTQAHYTIYHKDGKTAFAVNQTMGGGTWIYLGTFAFDKGASGKVVLSNQTSDGKVVTADAVRFGGGMGNIGRRAEIDSIVPNTKTDRSSMRTPRSQWQPRIEYAYQVSGYPRYLEGARYYMQWAGIPDSIWSPNHGRDDYGDDYKNRGAWVNYLAGGTKAAPDMKGLNIPVDLSFAFHSDAGTVKGDSIIGTLGIYQVSRYDGVFADGTSREANHDLCDLVLSSITRDVRALYEPRWTRRGMWDSRYFEAWKPRVPAMLLELLSHENFADMRYGLDPRFRFTVSRAVYKGILRYLSDAYGYAYVVQPLPVSHFAINMLKGRKIQLSWQPVVDSLEVTAVAKQYVVYKRVGNGDFDNGTLVRGTSFTTEIPQDVVVSYKVTAVNEGGESFPSEVLSVGLSSASDAALPVLVVNGFDRISAPDDYRSSDDEQAGFLADKDNGVPYLYDISFTGKMKEFRRSIPWTDDDSGGFGDSFGNCEKLLIAGNTFDYPALHGAAILKAGYSFVSTSRAALDVNLSPKTYSAVDVILGKQKQSKKGRFTGEALAFKTFDATMQQALTAYCKAGGNVLVSGAYVGTDLWFNELAPSKSADTQFAQNILKYKWRDNQAATDGEVKAVPSPLTTQPMTLQYYNRPNETSYVVESPDAIEPADPCAYTAFRYAENGLSGGVVFGGNATDHWRTVVLGFPFEAVKGGETQAQLMQAILNYLLPKAE